jgi:hypothetical protein
MSQATFVHIPVSAILAVLDKAGFSEITLSGGKYPVYERVFARQHHQLPNVQIRVYTSIDIRTGAVRGDSEDRIMVCAFYTKGKGKEDRSSNSRFLFSATGVNRASGLGDTPEAVTAIMDRLLSRMREVYGKAGRQPRCRCGEPLKFSKSRKRTVYDRTTGTKKDNPNFGRPYVACMSDSCDFFKWDVEEPKAQPKAKADPKAAPKPTGVICEDCHKPIPVCDIRAFQREANGAGGVPRVCEDCAEMAPMREMKDRQAAADAERVREQAAMKAEAEAQDADLEQQLTDEIDIMEYYNKKRAS